MYEVVLTASAKDDLEQITDWYESKQKGLGLRFIESYRNSRVFISEHPSQVKLLIEIFVGESSANSKCLFFMKFTIRLW